MVSIRYYSDKDYPELKEMLQENKLYDEVWEDRESLKRKIERDPQSILIAEEDEKIIGSVFIVEDGWNAFIWRLCVKKSHQKKGIGKLLMKRAEEIANERGVKETSLFIDPENKNLKEWYQKQNYEETKDWKFMYKKLR